MCVYSHQRSHLQCCEVWSKVAAIARVGADGNMHDHNTSRQLAVKVEKQAGV